MLNITTTKDNDTATIALEGRLDTITAPQFEADVMSAAKDASALTLDMAKLDYISSAGLRVLLSAQKKMSGGMKLVNVGETVMEIFEVTGFSDILTIE